MRSASEVKNLLNVTKEEKRKFINSFDYVLTDCDGVLWVVLSPIEGSGAAITELKKHGKTVLFITNNSISTPDEFIQKFKNSKVEATLDDVLHPALSTVHYLKKRNFEGLVYAIASPAFKTTIVNAGFSLASDGILSEKIEDRVSVLWKAVTVEEPVKAVVIDIDVNLSWAKLCRAEFFLKNSECLFIAGATDEKLPITDEYTMLGPGPFCKMLEESTNRKAVVVGKPGAALKKIVMDKFNIKDSKRVLFIGDMLKQDIGFGTTCGFQTLLVLTGGTKKEDLLAHTIIDELPNYYLERLADLLTIFEEIK